MAANGELLLMVVDKPREGEVAARRDLLLIVVDKIKGGGSGGKRGAAAHNG